MISTKAVAVSAATSGVCPVRVIMTKVAFTETELSLEPTNREL